MAAIAASIAPQNLIDLLRESASETNLFHLFVEQAPAMLWLTDTDGGLIYFNHHWLAFTGLPMEAVTGLGWVDCLHPDDRERCATYGLGQVAKHEALEMRYRLRRYDGRYFDMLVRGEPLYGSDGRFLGYAGCTIDITKQIDGERQLRDAHAALQVQSQNITLLNELNDNLQVCKNIEETKPILKRYGSKLFPTLGVTVSLYNESRNLIEPFVWWGDVGDHDALLSPDDCWALRKSKPHCELGDEEITGFTHERYRSRTIAPREYRRRPNCSCVG